MLDYYFTFRSMTAAQQAAAALNKSEIFASLLRAPRALSSMGCGYAVRVAFQSGPSAAAILHKSGVSYIKSFQMDISGYWKEVYL